MKVAIVTAFPRDAQKPVGGVEAVSVSLVRALGALADLDVHVVTTHRESTEIAQEHWEGATIHRLPHSGRPELLDAIGPGRSAVQEYLRKLRPDIVHAHDVYGLMVQGIALPRVFTIHGFIHADTAMSGTPLAFLRAWLWRRFETGGWAEQPHIVAISPYVRERLAGIARGVIHDIDNPIAPECFAIERHEAPATIFSAAALCRRKNPLALVEALACLRAQGVNARLRLAGHASEADYAQALMHRIAELGLNDCVTLLGSIGVERVRDELAAASVFALVSFEEGSPMGIEEAMAAGVPVVTSNRCGMPYMVRDGESGFLVDPHDTQEIAERLGQLLTNTALRSAMSEHSRRIALDRFHPASIALRTRAVYLRAIDAHSQAQAKPCPGTPLNCSAEAVIATTRRQT
jgi:glycosyltransferase involved in cell wall biosynthesis